MFYGTKGLKEIDFYSIFNSLRGVEMPTMKQETFPISSNDIDFELANIAMNHINEAIMFTDDKNRIIYVNKKFEETTGYTFDEIKGKTPKALQSGIQDFSFYEKMKDIVTRTGRWQGELWNRTKNGKVYLQYLSIIAIKDKAGKIKNFVGIFSDLTNKRNIDNQTFQYLSSYYDSLTGLPNRIIFEKRALSTLKRAEQTKNPFAILFFKFENYSKIKEKHGLIFGDILLKRISTRILNHLPENSTVTRWNDVEFACILESFVNEADIKKFVHKLNRKITSPIIVNGIEINLLTSIGVSIYEKDGKCVSELLSKANAAMKKAQSEKEVYQFYENEIPLTNKLFVMEYELKRAIEQDQFELYYQPLIEVESKKLIGFEALVRWDHPTAGVISPIHFIPLAEQTGLIVDLGNLIFKKACKQLSEWRNKGFTDIKINVNLSMNQFKDDNLVRNIEKTLKETKVPSDKIGIELTESTLSEDKEETITKLHQLKTLGFCIAIDDFGTGYSSLGYIIDFPVDSIKIDRSFIKVLNDNKKIEAIVSAINSMANTMDISVVAEGIETEEQFQTVQRLQCNVAQGYLFDQPLPKEEVEEKWLMK